MTMSVGCLVNLYEGFERLVVMLLYRALIFENGAFREFLRLFEGIVWRFEGLGLGS